MPFDIAKLPHWFLGAVLGLAVCMLVLLLLGFKVVSIPGGGLQVVGPDASRWDHLTNDTEEFNIECEYRWKLTGDLSKHNMPEFQDNFFYPSIVGPDELQMSFSGGNNVVIKSTRKTEALIDGEPSAVSVFKKCY